MVRGDKMERLPLAITHSLGSEWTPYWTLAEGIRGGGKTDIDWHSIRLPGARPL